MVEDDQMVWSQLFGNPRPVEIEIGSGTGTFLFAAARANPNVNYFGIEQSRSRAAALLQHLDQHCLPNVRVLAADASFVVQHVIPRQSVAAFHIYFPDPWWKRRHHRRRLFTPALIRALADSLQDGGRLCLATDVPLIIDLARKCIDLESRLMLDTGAASPRRAQTRFEQKGLARGAAIYDAVYRRQSSNGSG